MQNWFKYIYRPCCFLFLLALLPSCENRPKYSGPPEEQEAFWMMDRFTQSYDKSGDIELIEVGCFFPEIETKSRFLFGIWLRKYSELRLDDGRAFAVTFVQDFWKMLQKNPTTKKYVEYMYEYNPRKFPLKQVGLQYIGLKIAFWDKNNNRPPIPYLAQIAFFDEKFHYYQADPETQALRLVLVESFEEALAKVN